MTENNSRLIQTKSILNNIFDILRVDINVSEYNFALYLLVLQMEGILDGLLSENIYNLLQDLSYKIVNSNNSKSNYAKIYERIWDVFQPVLVKLQDSTLRDMLLLLRNLDQSLLHKHFPEIFDDLLYKITKSQGAKEGNSILPIELSQFLSNLIELPNGAKIYNPFAGLASFGVFTNETHQYLGQELNYTTWALGQLRLIAYNREASSKFLLGDSIEDWNPKRRYETDKFEDIFDFPSEKEKYDLIIANPPFNLRSSYPLQNRFGNFRNCEPFFIEKGLEDLKPDGKLVLVSSLGFLYRGNFEQRLRNYLVDNEFLEMVIAFPEGLLFNTNIPFAVVVVNMNKKNKGFIKFIDAKSTVETTSFREKRINVASLDKIVKEDVVSEHIRIVPNETIARFDYNLNVPRYFQKDIEGIQFGELVNSIRPQKSYEDIYGRFVRVRDLKEDKLEYFIDIKKIEKIELPRNAQKISKSCLLLASRWKTLKPTFFEFSGESIFITPDTIALKVDESKVNVAYLINELHADYITEQVDAYRVGNTIPMVKREDLLMIKIRFLNLIEQQVAKMNGVKEAYIASKKIQLQLEQELLGLEDNVSREFASMKHTLRQYLSALKSNVLGTKKFISNNEGIPINLSTIYSKNLNQTFEDHLCSLEGTIDSMSKVLLSLDEKHGSVDPIRNHNLHTLVTKAQYRFGNSAIFEFYDVYVDTASFESVEPIITIAEHDFYKLFSNIISNAVSHGFKNSTKRNLISIRISYNASFNSCELTISNNGRPIPKQFTLKHLTTRGEKTTDSSGSGIGGADIKAIVEKHNGYFDLATDEDNDFPVTYILGFPLLTPIEDAI
jgi:type I restriction enzyme M protein